MKLKKFIDFEYINENNNSKFDEYKNEFDVIYDSEKWLVTKPKSYEALKYWSKDGNINMDSYKNKYTNLFLNTNKTNESKVVLDFNNKDFFTLDDEEIYLMDLFDENKELLELYGKNLNCKNVVNKDNEYWLVINDYTFFSDYFKVDNNTRDDLIKLVLSYEAYSIFSYSPSDFEINENIDLNDSNLEILKLILLLESINDDEIEIDIDEITTYSDIVDVVKEYDLDVFKTILKDSICSAHEAADEAEAFDDIIKTAYKFFNLSKESATWENNGAADSILYIKFNSDIDAYKAKIIINKYDESYNDDNKISYSPPYYGYSGDINDSFNDIIRDKIYEYDSDFVKYQDISETEDFLKEKKETNPNILMSEIKDEIKMILKSKKYNI